MAKSKLKRSNIIFAIVSSIILGLFSLIYIGLLFWALISSLKSLLDFGYNPFGFPRTGKAYGWRFENYYIAYRIMNVQIVTATEITYVKAAGMFLNSILYASGCALFAVFWTSLVAYCCAKFDYKICKIIYAMVVVVIILPIVGALPSEVQMSKTLGLYNSIPGLWIMRSGFQNVNFLVFYGVFKAVPKTYSEAAAIDGASSLQRMVRITLPLVSPFTSYQLITGLIGGLNSFGDNYVIVSGPDSNTVIYWIYRQFMGGDYGLVGAASIVVGIIIFVLSLPNFRRMVKAN